MTTMPNDKNHLRVVADSALGDYDPTQDKPSAEEWATILRKDVLDAEAAGLDTMKTVLGMFSPGQLMEHVAKNYAHIQKPLVQEPGVGMVTDRTYSLNEAIGRERERREARRVVDQMEAQAVAVEMPRMVRLDEFLAEPRKATAYRIDKLWPRGGRIVLAAMQKAGKTTTTGNVVRSLVDGEPFMGTYFTEPVGHVAVLDNEMGEDQLREWMDDYGIKNQHAVSLVPMRGRVSTFNILDPTIRTMWADRLRGVDVMIFDCLRPAMDALGLDENHDAGRFLVALDELAREAGIAEVLVVHHMGHHNERSRGDSRIGDWPDANWKILPTIVNNVPDPHGPRYFSAYGRDVEVFETQTAMDPATRRLSIVGGSRKQAKTNEYATVVLDYVANAEEPPSGRAIDDALYDAGHPRAGIRAARRQLVKDGALIEAKRQGKGGGMAYFVKTEPEDLL